ncbi:hypothetical protein IQ235_14065 [Oscillatoriales cyanobacterium LEGE 11467]|uniref:Uncharacterized protein n=1 Tax=Zarconia navalis LEGE 11467 TaxID=1828826 RepID=A0A928Z9N9_9CYAN|nr:hypothetical protein [Zarconia navalis]MBE9041904.1 hypothetical protein [Zarconia navalis LEGE 11467]
MVVILSPVNPWLQGQVVQDRLLEYWQSKQSKESRKESHNSKCPFMTVSIEV